MQYTVGQAAKAVGKNKATLHRMIKAGRLSAVHDDATGALRVDAAELHRVFPPVPDSPAATADSSHTTAHATSRDEGRDEALRAKLEAAELRIADKDGTIADLRRRLDASEEERRRLTLMLADQRASPPAPARRSWWPWRRA